MTCRAVVVLSAGLLALSASVAAFDGQRKGLVLGAGLGFAPVAHWSSEYQGRQIDESVTGFGEYLLIGYGWDQRNILAVKAVMTLYNSDLYDAGMIQGFGGLAWYHYYGKPGNSFFSIAGGGVSRMGKTFEGIKIHFGDDGFVDSPEAPKTATGPAYLIGGGWEFLRHYQVTVFLIGGDLSEHGQHYGIYDVYIMISAFAF
jgi:hypothetical protein